MDPGSGGWPKMTHFWPLFGPLFDRFWLRIWLESVSKWPKPVKKGVPKWPIFEPFLSHFWAIFEPFLDHFLTGFRPFWYRFQPYSVQKGVQNMTPFWAKNGSKRGQNRVSEPGAQMAQMGQLAIWPSWISTAVDVRMGQLASWPSWLYGPAGYMAQLAIWPSWLYGPAG